MKFMHFCIRLEEVVLRVLSGLDSTIVSFWTEGASVATCGVLGAPRL
jgi:hypothetical protein